MACSKTRYLLGRRTHKKRREEKRREEKRREEKRRIERRSQGEVTPHLGKVRDNLGIFGSSLTRFGISQG